jgi:hypothetical protein
VNLNDPVAIAAREYNQGLGLEREGKRAEALQSFDRALLFSPLDPEILAARSRVAGP